jgi:hypothetical protein
MLSLLNSVSVVNQLVSQSDFVWRTPKFSFFFVNSDAHAFLFFFLVDGRARTCSIFVLVRNHFEM